MVAELIAEDTIEDLIDSDTSPRWKITCINIVGLVLVTTDNEHNVCPICKGPISKKGACMTVKRMVWQHAIDSVGSARKRGGPNFNGSPSVRESTLEKARKEVHRNCSNPHLIHRLN